jgi:hypothetical protein
MKEKPLLNCTALLEEAKASGHEEAYRTLERNTSYRIGAGVRQMSPNLPSFFVEVLINLCPSFSNVDLVALEKSVTCLRELKARNYVQTCQDGNYVSCEITVPASNLAEEYDKVRTLMKASFR